MISFFRKTLGSKIALGLLSLIVLAFIITGVFTREMPGASSLTGTGDTLVTVGDHTIGATEMEGRVRSQFAQYAQQQPGLDMPTFVATGGFDAVVSQVIGATAIEIFGRSIGLAPSKKLIDGQIAGIPGFQGPDGKFNQQAYLAALAQQHLTDQSVRSDIAGDLVRKMLYLPASGAVKLADGLIQPYAALLVEKRHGTIGLVPFSATAGGPAPTDADLQSFYKAHTANYMIAEQRVLRYALVGRDQVAAASTPGEADIRKAYDAGSAKYAAHELRTLAQVILPTQDKAKAFQAAVSGGKSFEEAAKAYGFSATDIAIGQKSQADFAALSSTQVAAAAFALPQGGLSQPVKDDFGWHVVKAVAVDKIAGTPYEKARPDIAADLTKQNQDKALAGLIAKVQDALDGGKSFPDTAKAYGLTVTETPAITSAGLSPDQPAFKPSADVQPLLKDGFQANSGDAPTLETIQQGERYALLSVGRVIPAAPIPFAQAKGRLAADVTAKRASDRAKAIATAIQAKVKGGMSMADAFKSAPVALQPPQPAAGRRVDLSHFQGNVPAALKALFQTSVGKTALVPGEAGQGWFVVRTDSVEPADAASIPMMIATSRDELTQSATSEYLEQIANASEKVVGVKRDEAKIGALKLRLMGATPAQ